MLGSAQPDPLGSQLAGFGRVSRRIGVGPHPQPADLVRPPQHLLKAFVELGLKEACPVFDDRPLRPIDADQVSGAEHLPVDPHLASLQIDRQTGAGHRRHAHAAGHQRGV